MTGVLCVSVRNFWIKAKRSTELYQRVEALLNIGVLVKYPMGQGGVILNQLNIPEHEANARNVEKKRRIAAALLKNLGAPLGPH